MRDRAVTFVFAVLLSSAVHAQVFWQPTPPPVVTAENTSWFIAAEPIQWFGDLVYPSGTPQFFSRYKMVRSGSYRGIPLYTDVTLEPNTVVFVPLAGERMQPYARVPQGQVAGPALRVVTVPSDIDALGTLPGGIQQAPMPPTLGPAYDVLTAPEVIVPAALRATLLAEARDRTAVSNETPPVATPAARPGQVGTSGRTAAPDRTRLLASAVPPTGLNGIWITYDGQRWFANGNAIGLNEASFREVGSYHGFPVYRRVGDDPAIYVPTTPGRVAPYKRR